MDAKTSQTRPRRSGFTLVELLVVIAIISMLVGLLSVAVPATMHAVKRMRILSEISQLAIALEDYKVDVGEYPPDCFCINYTDTDPNLEATRDRSRNAILRHFRKRFQRYRPGAYTESLGVTPTNLGTTSLEVQWNSLRLDVYNASSGLDEDDPNDIDPDQGFDLNNLDPSSALMFFLGGIPDYEPDTSASRLPSDPAARGGELMGFSENPVIPISRGGGRVKSSCEFDVTRIAWDNNAHIYKYFPKHIRHPANSSMGVPYVYFRPRSSTYGPQTLGDVRNYIESTMPRYPLNSSDPLALDSDIGICLPYARRMDMTNGILTDTSGHPDANRTSKYVDWYADRRYQLITAGLDGTFGTTDAAAYDPANDSLDMYRYFTDGDNNNLTREDTDNLTNIMPGQLGNGNP